MTEKKKRTPSATTLKVRAFAKWQRAKDELARRKAARAASEAKHERLCEASQNKLDDAAMAYTELTGEQLPE